LKREVKNKTGNGVEKQKGREGEKTEKAQQLGPSPA
jgi:hypothetical protein